MTRFNESGILTLVAELTPSKEDLAANRFKQRISPRKVADYTEAGHRVVITKTPSHVAYAKNGNAHNPTVYWNFVAAVDGRVVWHHRLLREVKAFVTEYIEGGCE